MYKAQIRQNTGVDWKHIKLSLSSGNPNEQNEITLLHAWYLRFGSRYTERQTAYIANSLSYKKGVKDTEKNVINEVSMDRYTEVNENQLNTSFDINTPYDILSNGKEHSVSLKELKIKAKYEYYAAPRVDNGIYLIALVDDYSQYNLLAGEANIIFEDMYVGKTMINPHQASAIRSSFAF